MKSVRQKIKDGDYNVQAHYPRSRYECACKRVFRLTSAATFCEDCGAEVRTGIERANAEYHNMRKIYERELAERMEEFTKDALAEVGLTDHPKAAKVFVLAWDQGHAGGYHEVFEKLEDLAELTH